MINLMCTLENETASSKKCLGSVSIFLSALLLGGCGWMTDSTIVVRNVGPSKVEKIQLEVGGGVITVHALASGDSVKIKPKITGDSTLRIRYYEGVDSVVCDGDVYLTNNMRARIEAEIGGGTCKVVDVT